MTSDTKGDSTTSKAQEHMLWLRYEGGQLPIGWAEGPVATIQLYGKTWTLYRGLNKDTGIMVSSLIVDKNNQYYGRFTGDIKKWLVALSKQGLFSESTYVNVGNAGMGKHICYTQLSPEQRSPLLMVTEPFYGEVSWQNTLALQVNVA